MAITFSGFRSSTIWSRCAEEGKENQGRHARKRKVDPRVEQKKKEIKQGESKREGERVRERET